MAGMIVPPVEVFSKFPDAIVVIAKVVEVAC
jgi:hypothetical protein